jgi:uncharacterized membrane protein YidH (DUF202 family)
MLERILDNLKRNYQQETLAERRQRMIPAAAFGALIVTAYLFTFNLVNVYTFPTLPLGMDWERLFVMWIQFAVAFAVFGAIAAWFTEEYQGIVGGGIIVTALLAIAFLFSSSSQNSAVTLQSIIMALPLLGVSMLAAWGLRWAANRYQDIKRDEKPASRRKRLTKHVLTLVLIGLVPGILMRMDLPSLQTIGQLHELLQAAPNDRAVWPQLPLERVPALQDHFGVDYVIYARQSPRSAGALDVTVRFSDGFIMSCFLPIESGTNFITHCNEGEAVEASP